MGKAVGLFLENGNVKAAEVTGSARRMRIGRVLSQTALAAQALAGEGLRDFFDRFRLSRDNVVLCLSGCDAVLRCLKLPISNLRQIERTVKFQAEKFLFEESLEDVVADFFVVNQTETDTDIFLLVIKKDQLRSKLHELAQAGISPVGVTLDAVALFNLVAAANVFPEAGAAALLEFSSEACRIILVRDGNLIFLRTLKVTGMGPVELAQRVAREIKASCLIAGVEGSLTTVIVAGNAIEGTTRRTLAQRLNTDIATFNPFATFPSATTEEENGGSDDAAAIALGAALKGIHAESVPVDFRKEEFALRRGFDFVRNKLLYFFAVLTVLFGLLAAQSYYDAAQKQAYLGRIESEAQIYWKWIFPKKPFPRNTFDKWIKSSSARRKTDAPQGRQYRSFLETIRRIATVLPKQQTATVRSISFDQRHAVLVGIAEDFSQFDALVGALRNMQGYKVSEKFEKRGRRGGQQKLVFTIELIPLGEVK